MVGRLLVLNHVTGSYTQQTMERLVLSDGTYSTMVQHQLQFWVFVKSFCKRLAPL